MNTKIIVFLMTAVVGLVLNTQAQILRGEPDKEGEVEKVRSAVVIVNQGLDVSKEELTFQGTYQQNETDMAFRSQARERGLCDFAKHYRTNVIVEPYVKIKKKKGFANAGQPMFDEEDFMAYFEDRVSEMIRNEIEAHFRDLFYKSY